MNNAEIEVGRVVLFTNNDNHFDPAHQNGLELGWKIVGLVSFILFSSLLMSVGSGSSFSFGSFSIVLEVSFSVLISFNEKSFWTTLDNL